MSKLNQEILSELLRGTRTLLPGDQYKVQIAPLVLLAKPLAYKKSWLINVMRARQRFLLRKHHDDELEVKSRNASQLIKWMMTKQTPG